MNAKAAAVSSSELLQLDPKDILAVPEDNKVRFGILQSAKEELKASILNAGGVKVPVAVVPIEGATKAPHYKLVTGFTRHAVVEELNKDQKAGLTLPAVVVSDTDALSLQLIENKDRKALTPMDLAVAIKAAFDAGLTRLQIRELFSRPTGKKGALEPASNAWVNMTLSFLDLPKHMQERIHDGRVGMKAAYQLTRVTPEKRAAVLERAEADVLAEAAREEKEEKSYVEQEAKVEALAKETQDATIKIDEAKAELELAEKLVEQKQKDAAEAYTKAMNAKGDEKKKAEEKRRALEADAKGAEKKMVSAKKALEKLTEGQQKSAKATEEARARLEAARNAKKAGGSKANKPLGEKDIKKAAAAEGAGTGAVPLNAGEMRKVIADLTLASAPQKVQEIAVLIKACFDGEDTPGQLLKKLTKLVGAKK